MKNTLFIALLVIALFALCLAQTQFAIAIGGSHNEYEASVVQTTDSGYVITGQTASFGAGSFDLFLAKFSLLGAVEWSYAIGGTSTDEGLSVIETSDGGYAVAGGTFSFGAGDEDLLLVKFNSTGSPEWLKALGGIHWDRGYSVVQTTDGGYAVAGLTWSFGTGTPDCSNFFLVKFSSIGIFEWAKAISGRDYDYGFSVSQTFDGGYVVGGWTQSISSGWYNILIMKFNSTGSVEWSKAIGGTNTVRGYSVIQTTDGGYAIAGESRNFGADYFDLLLVKLNSAGSVEWSKSVSITNNVKGCSIIQTTDGGYAIAGNTYSSGEYQDLLIMKFSSTGEQEWATVTNNSEGISIAQTSDEGFVVTGEYYGFGAGGADLFLVKFDAVGNSCIGENVTPVVISVSPTVTSVTPSVTTVSPTITTITPTITDVSPIVTDVCADTNHVPSFTLCPCPDDTAICRDSTLMVEVLAEDDDGDTVSYSLIAAPEGASMDSTTLVYTPPSTGVFHIIITACDPFDACDTCDFYVAVDSCAINTPPEFVVCPDDTAIYLGDTLMTDILVEDADGDTIFYFIVDAPSGTSLEYPVLTFIPSDTGNFFFSITACDPFDACDTCDFYVAVDSCDTDAVLEKPIKPDAFFLDVQPNPFNSSCAITINVGDERARPATIEIFDLNGKCVGAGLAPAQHQGDRKSRPYIWCPTKETGSGIYFVKATTEDGLTTTRRVVYLK